MQDLGKVQAGNNLKNTGVKLHPITLHADGLLNEWVVS